MGLTPYANRNGDSNVVGYELYYRFKDDPLAEWPLEYWAIQVDFKSGTHRSYFYTLDSAGIMNLHLMKNAAQTGYGLNGYINRFAKYKYKARM